MAKKLKATKVVTSSNIKEKRAKQNQQQLVLLLGVLGLALVLIIGVVVVSQLSTGSAKAIGENETYAGIPLSGRYEEVREIALGSDVAAGVVRGVDDNGIPFIGDPNAPIQIAEFADFSCPACRDYEETINRVIKDFVRNGDMAFYFYPLPANSRDPYASNAARAAMCAVEQGGFWELHDEIFRIHRAESYASFTLDRLEKMANDVGINGRELRTCMNSNRPEAAIVASGRVAAELGVSATPTMMYRFPGQARWTPFNPSGNMGGGIPYDALAQRIREANLQAGG